MAELVRKLPSGPRCLESGGDHQPTTRVCAVGGLKPSRIKDLRMLARL